ncbi:hypothetical protein ACVJGB_004642 [Bradyrhizobium liaoningense]
MSRACARGSAMPAATGCFTRPAALPSPASAFSRRRPAGTKRKCCTRASAGLPAAAPNTPSRRTGARGSNISTASSRTPTSPFPPAGNIRRRWIFTACASASIARSTGRACRPTTRNPTSPTPSPAAGRFTASQPCSGRATPRFHAPYTGPNSLLPSPDFQQTWSNSLYLNARLWDGGEVYFNPELLQGFGFNNTTGAAGFPNGEAQKSGFPYPHFNASRLFVRHTFGFGGEQEELASGQFQLAGKADVSRLTLQVGKFSVVDVFDGNAYAHDPRKDFMNWSIWASGAFDYAADKLGLGYGATAELNQKQWALRGGYFLMDAVSNSNNFDMNIGRRGEYVAELELRYSLFGQPGKLRTLGFVNSAFSGSYRETLDNPAFGVDISQTRRGRLKYGYAFNLEQAITGDIGVFGRWSWNDGRNEIMAFTDIDRSLSGGVSVKGTTWGRPDDVVAIAGAVNALSQDHRDFIAAGGLGPLIGDGRLNYRRERVLETYYAYALNKALTFTADYQLIVNPAYNADRGPVSVFSGRLHGEF